jgi:transcriptional regulator with XRE-family HTH domain
MLTSKSDIANRLKQAREQLGITQEKFAIPLGLQGNNVKDIEIGRKNIMPELALLIEKIHGINFRWLLTGGGEMFLLKEEDISSTNGETANSSTDVMPSDRVEFFASAMAFAKELAVTGTHDERIRAAKFLKWAIEELEAPEVERLSEQRSGGVVG